jgi:hypothetical protein
MRDSYVADVGDFGKYALLKALAGNDLRLGVVWCRNTLEDASQDGRFTEYAQLRSCDPALHDNLLQILKGNQRTLVEVEKGSILPRTALFYGDPIPAPHAPCLSPAARDAQARLRETWFEQAFNTLSDAELVFLDPDNGLAGSRVKRHCRNSVKFVFTNEVTDWLGRGQSVVLYQHQQRKPLNEQVAEQRKMFGTGTTCLAVSFHRRSVRIYYILSARDHRVRLSERLTRFLAGAWGEHFSPA